MNERTSPTALLPDARPASLVLRLTPAIALPFVQLARWDRPAGWQLLLAPCWQSAALAGLALHRGPNPWHLLLFLIGAVAMRGAGCTYNDILDRELDAGVERTRGRPLPSGRVGVKAAAAFLVAQSLVGLAVLLCFNGFSIRLGFASLVVVAIYPLMKRVTSWPQAVLGLAFSWGALMGWSAAFGALAWPAIALYGSAFCWTVGYDTIYAQQDARDDAVVGIKSTARLFGARARARRRRVLRAGGGARAVGAAGRRGGADRGSRLGRLQPASGLAGLPHRRRQSRDGAAAVPLEPRRGVDPFRRAGAERVGGAGLG